MYFKILLIFVISKRAICLENEGKPIIQDLFTSSKIIEDKSLFLSCQVTGKQPMQFEWFKNDKKIEQNDNIFINNLDAVSILNIKSMSFENVGSFTCRVLNSFGFDSKTVNLKLNGKLIRKVQNVKLKQ